MALIDDLKAATAAANADISSEASNSKSSVLGNINATLMAAANAGSRAVMIDVDEAFPSVDLNNAQDVSAKLDLLVEILNSEGINSSRMGNQATASW